MTGRFGEPTDSKLNEPGGLRRAPSLVVVGASFRTAGIGPRERIAGRLSRIREAGLEFGIEGVLESSVVETCNRTEVYLASYNPDQAALRVIERLGAGSNEPFYVKGGLDAIRHIFSVAAGLDSPVVGEEQILDQVWEAGRTSRVSGKARSILSSLFDAAYSSGRRIRGAYRVSSSNRSLSVFALRHALRELGRQPRRVLLIGSGEASKLAAIHLRGSKVHLLSGRRDTSSRFPGAIKISRRDLRRVASACDLIIAATKHRGYVLTQSHFSDKGRKIVLDLGFPRNVDPALRDSGFIRLYDLDDIVSWTASRRITGLRSAEKLVDEEAQRFNAWLTATRLTPTLGTIFKWAESIREEETGSALRKLQGLSPRDKTVVEAMSRRLTSKLLAPHATFVKNEGKGGDLAERLRLLQAIFIEGSS